MYSNLLLEGGEGEGKERGKREVQDFINPQGIITKILEF